MPAVFSASASICFARFVHNEATLVSDVLRRASKAGIGRYTAKTAGSGKGRRR